MNCSYFTNRWWIWDNIVNHYVLPLWISTKSRHPEPLERGSWWNFEQWWRLDIRHVNRHEILKHGHLWNSQKISSNSNVIEKVHRNLQNTKHITGHSERNNGQYTGFIISSRSIILSKPDDIWSRTIYRGKCKDATSIYLFTFWYVYKIIFCLFIKMIYELLTYRKFFTL